MRKIIPTLPLYTDPAVGVMIRIILNVRLGFLIDMLQPFIINAQQLIRTRRAEIQGFLISETIGITKTRTIHQSNPIRFRMIIPAMLDALIEKFRLVVNQVKSEVAARQMEDKFFAGLRVKPSFRIAFLRNLKAERANARPEPEILQRIFEKIRSKILSSLFSSGT